MIGRRSLLILLNNLAGGFLGFFALRFVLALPKEGFGAFAWASSTIGIAALLTSFGFPQAHIKRVNEGRDESAANGTFFLVKVSLTAIFAVLILGGYLVWRVGLGRGFTDATTAPIFVTCVVIYILLSLRQYFDTVFQSHQHTARAESVLLVDTVTSVLGVVFAYNLFFLSQGWNTGLAFLVRPVLDAWNIEGPLGPDEAGLLLALAYCLGRAVSLVYAAVQFLAHQYPMGRPRRDVYDSYRSLGFPLAIVAGLNVLYANIDRFFLGYFYDKEEVARFSAPLQILTPMLFVSTAVGTLLFPQISRLDAQGDHALIQRYVERAERYMAMLLVPMLVLAVVFAREGINIFNAQYLEQENVLRVLLIFVFFNVVASPSRILLLGLGRPKRLLWLGILNVALVTGLILILVPTWGLGLRSMGAALAAAAASVVSFVWVKNQTRDVTSAAYWPTSLNRQLVAGLLVLGILAVARQLLGPAAFTRFYQLGLTAAVAGLLYLGLLVLFREFRREDRDFFTDLMHPGKLAGYVGTELTPPTRPRPPPKPPEPRPPNGNQ